MELLSLREKHEYEAEIERLKAVIKRHVSHKSKIKIKYDKLLAERNEQIITRSDQARELIKQKWNGEVDITLQGIADTVFLSYRTVQELSSEYKLSAKDDLTNPN